MFNETVEKAKELLKGFLTSEAKKEDIDKIAEIDKLIDKSVEEYKATTTELSSLKDDYIKVIKNTAFKIEGDPQLKDVGGSEEKAKTFAECLAEAKKQNGAQ